MGERDSDQARRSAIFSARIVPIAPYSSKRIEMEYHEPIPVEDLKSVFALPQDFPKYSAKTEYSSSCDSAMALSWFFEKVRLKQNLTSVMGG